MCKTFQSRNSFDAFGFVFEIEASSTEEVGVACVCITEERRLAAVCFLERRQDVKGAERFCHQSCCHGGVCLSFRTPASLLHAFTGLLYRCGSEVVVSFPISWLCVYLWLMCGWRSLG